GNHSTGPGAKVLGCDLGLGDLPQIVVHMMRLDILALAVVVEILKELLSAKILTALHNLRDALVVDGHRVIDATLAAEFKAHLRSGDRHVLALERRQAIRLVDARELLGADGNQRSLEQPD